MIAVAPARVISMRLGTIRKHLRSCPVAILLLAGSAVIASASQDRTVLRGEPSCPTCQVSLREVVTLGDSQGPGLIETTISQLHKDPRDRYYVTSTGVDAVVVFDSAGQSLGRLGREGSGPGEFRRITAFAVGKKDSLHVFDEQLSRLTVFSHDHELLAAHSLTFRPNLFDAALVGEQVVLNAEVRTPEAAGYPLQLLGPAGELRRSFGSETGLYRSDLAYRSRRALSAAADGGVWAGYLNQYVIERWTLSGVLEQIIERRVEWFEPYWQTDERADQPRRPFITGIVDDHEGLLWVLVAVPGLRWQEAVEPSPGNDPRFFTITDYNVYLNTVVEVIDLKRGRLVASGRVPRLLWGFVGDHMVYGFSEDTDGNLTIPVWNIEIVEPAADGR